MSTHHQTDNNILFLNQSKLRRISVFVVTFLAVGVSLLASLAWKEYWFAVKVNGAGMATAHLVSDFIHSHNRPPSGWKELESDSTRVVNQYGFSDMIELERILDVHFREMYQPLGNTKMTFLKSRQKGIMVHSDLDKANDWISIELSRLDENKGDRSGF